MRKEIFSQLKDKYGTHKAAAMALGVSYSRYNEWRWRPHEVPTPMERYMELVVKFDPSPPRQAQS